MSSPGYQVIARKWRPQVFEDVYGQDHVVRTLKNAITRNRIAHAYLFVGPRGTGKTSTARIFAKALNCEKGPTPTPCGTCAACKDIAAGTHLDVIEIDGASNNGVDQVRDLRDTVQYAPAAGRYKVYIIDEVHMLSAAAFNALLKTLEEPPAHVKFIFATTEAQKVLATIVSRCQRFDLRPISDEIIAARLKQIAEAEKIEVSPAALAGIARLADGGMRDSQSIFDQLIAFCGSKIEEGDVLDVYGLVGAAEVAKLAAAIATGDHKKIVEMVDAFDASGRDLFRLLADLQTYVRKSLLEAIHQGGKTRALGAELTTEQLTRLLDALHEGEGGVKFGLSEKVNFEITLLKAVENSRSRAIDSVLKEILSLADAAPGEKKKGLTESEPAAPRDVAGSAAASAESDGVFVSANTAQPGADTLKRLAAREAAEAAGGVRATSTPALNASSFPGATPPNPASNPFAGSGGAGSSAPAASDDSDGAPVGSGADDGEPVGPSAADEAEMRDSGMTLQRYAPPGATAESSGAALPSLDSLIARIPKETRIALDEQLRARFVRVKRLKPGELR